MELNDDNRNGKCLQKTRSENDFIVDIREICGNDVKNKQYQFVEDYRCLKRGFLKNDMARIIRTTNEIFFYKNNVKDYKKNLHDNQSRNVIF